MTAVMQTGKTPGFPVRRFIRELTAKQQPNLPRFRLENLCYLWMKILKGNPHLMKFNLLTLLVSIVSFSQAYAQTPAAKTANASAGTAPVSMSQTTNPHLTLTDSQIVEIVRVANEADIDGGKSAEKKATSTEVKNFAKEMVRDHTAANRKILAFAKSEHMVPQPNDTSNGMQKMTKVTADHLSEVKREDFDREYILAEMTMHKEVLTSLDDDLIPGTKNARLKAILKDARKMVSDHLEKAKAIDTKLISNR
jgi:putative membrane protein